MQHGIGNGWLGIGAATLSLGVAMLRTPQRSHVERREITFEDGFRTDARDGGRPVILIAAALGVTPEVFRDAFSHVHPARGGEPDPAQVQRNKQALLSALGRYGVTNDLLDEVSNYYRYMASRGETWRHRAATGYANVLDGKVKSITLTDEGAGYSSPPIVEIEGLGAVDARVNLRFTRHFETNGSIRSIDVGHDAASSLPKSKPSAGIEEALRREAIPREIVDQLNLSAEQQRQMVGIANSTNDRRELHERAMQVLTPPQRKMVESGGEPEPAG